MRALRLLALLMCGVLVSGAVSAQSLGDVAKKEEERRKQVPSGKVYTNKDLGAVPPSSVPPPPPPDASGKPADADKDSKGAAKDDKDKDKDKPERSTQAYWQGRRKELQAALEKDTSFAEALQSRINALTTEFVNRDNPVQRAAIEKDRQKALADLANLKKQVAADQKGLADLEEEARRAGVPPGWLR